MPDVGYGIGLSAQSTDRVEMLAGLAQKKLEYIADAKKKQDEYDQKKKDAALEKESSELYKLADQKFDDLYQKPAIDASQTAWAELLNKVQGARSDQDILQVSTPILMDLGAKLKSMQVAGKNLDWYRNADDSKLDADGKYVKNALKESGGDYNKFKEAMENAPASPFAPYWDPNTGAVGLPWVSKVDLNKEVDNSIAKVRQLAPDKVKTNNALATQYDEYLNHIFETDDEVKTWAAKPENTALVAALGHLPPSIQSLATDFTAPNNPDGPSQMQEWLHSQMMTAEDQKKNMPIYFNSDGTMKQDVVAKDYKNYVFQEMKSHQPQTFTKESGRPESSSSRGAGSYDDRVNSFKAKAKIIGDALSKAKAEQSKVKNNRRATQSEKDAADVAVQTLEQQQSQLENSREDFENGKFNGSIDELPGWKEYAKSTGATTTGTSKDDDFSQYKRK